MRAGQYVTSARRACILLLVLDFASLTLADNRIRSYGFLIEAREALASYLHGVRAPGPWSSMHLPGIGTMTFIADTVSVEDDRGRLVWRVVIYELPEGEAMARLEAAALGAGVSLSGGADTPVARYREIEAAIAKPPVTIPGAGITINVSSAPWALLFTALALLVLVTSRLRVLVEAHADTRDDPWLILDSATGLEKATGTLWLIGVLASPWITAVALVIELRTRVLTQGVLSNALEDLVAFAVVFALMAVAARLAARLTGQVLVLRARQRSAPEAAAPAADSP